MNRLINESMSDEAVYRTALATPGLLVVRPTGFTYQPARR